MVLCVKNLSRHKVVAFLFKSSDARVVLRAIITRYFVPTGLTIGVTLIDTRIDIASESQKDCLSLLVLQCIPYHTGVAGQTLNILRVKASAVLLGVTESVSGLLLVEVMVYVDDLSNRCVTNSLDHRKSIHKL